MATLEAPAPRVESPALAERTEINQPAAMARLEQRDGSDMSGMTRMFPPATEISSDRLDEMQLSPDQLRLERNLIYRDQNPKAHFNDPALEAAINRITGTTGDATDPANQATKMDLTGSALDNVLTLQRHEAAARIEQWRKDNPDKMIPASIPAGLNDDQIAQANKQGVQDAINDLYAKNGFPFSGRRLQQLYAQIPEYMPNPRFDEAKFSPEDREYLRKLSESRAQLAPGEKVQ